MNLKCLALAVVLPLAACAGPRHGLVDDDGRLRFSDVPVPPGYALLTQVSEEDRAPLALTYETESATPLSETELVAFYTAELPKHGWSEIKHDAATGKIQGKKPASSSSCTVHTRIAVTASAETRAVLEAVGGESPEEAVARMLTITRGAYDPQEERQPPK